MKVRTMLVVASAVATTVLAATAADAATTQGTAQKEGKIVSSRT